MRRIGIILILLSIVVDGNAQQKALTAASKEVRLRMHQALEQSEEKKEAIEFARKYDIPVRVIEADGRVIEIKRIIDGKRPEYLITHNITSARTMSTEALWNGVIEGISLNGEGMIAAVWDGGSILSSHVEFAHRTRNFDVWSDVSGHATHVAGTIGAKGLVSDAHGMANQIQIESHDWDNDNNEMRLAAENGLLLSNHSYGSINGFDYNNTEARWEWHGDPEIATREDYSFGIYGYDAQTWDQLSCDYPYYMIVKSAGNDRLEGPGEGNVHYIWDNGWEQSTVSRSLDGAPNGFDCIGSEATAKNILTVGAVRDIESGYQSPDDVLMTSFSGFGPTDDGRIKPDIVANGQGLYSTYNQSDNDYRSQSGTSMSAPSVTGSLALLQQLHHIKFNTYLKSASLKAIVLHTADDAGNPGPDYKFGWGLMNTQKAAELISASSTKTASIIEDSIVSTQVREYTLYMDGSADGRVSICWTDPAGKRPLPALDPKDTILVNDLDMRITKYSDQTLYLPYILDPDNPDQDATYGDNTRDNIEQLNIPAEAGFYLLSISHKGDIEDSIQDYSLVMDGMYQVFLAPESDTLTDNNGELLVTDAPEYPSNSNFNWLIEPENNQAIYLTFSSFETEAGDVLRIYDGQDNTTSLIGEFSGNLPYQDTAIISGGGSMFLEFITLATGGSQGFKANYCTTEPEKISSIFGEDLPCLGNTEEYLITAKSGIDYTWDISEASVDTSILNSNIIQLASIDKPLVLSITPFNSCGIGDNTTMKIRPVSLAPEIAGGIEGDTLPCINAASIFSVEYDSDAKYNWIIPKEWTSSNDSSRIWITPLLEAGTIQVVPYNSCGSDDTISLSLAAKGLPPKPIIISEKANPCQNSLLVCDVIPPAAYNYQWKTDDNWQIIGADSLVSVTLKIDDVSSGKLTVITSNKCGDTPVSRDYIFAPQPDIPSIKVVESSINGLEELKLENFSSFSKVSWFLHDSLLLGEQESLLIQRNGEYSLEVKNAQGCSRILDIEDRILISDEDLLFSIYGTSIPGQFVVMNDTPDEAFMEGFDLMGKAIFRTVLSQGENHFSTSDRGTIIIKFTGSGYTKSQVIILP